MDGVSSEFQLPRETLADRVTTVLRQQILSGRLAPGQLMPTERDLREAFGVGRTTVREALHGLVASGFLDRRNNQLYVRDQRQIPEHDVDYAAMAARLSVEDVFETRKALESKAVELAAKQWADDDLVRLRAALDAMKDRTGAEYHTADVEFHTLIVRIAKNTVLGEVYEGSKALFFKLPSFWRLFGGTPDGAASRPITGWEGHRRIVDAIERRDAAEAVRLNNEMLDRVASTLIERMSRALQTTDGSTVPTGTAGNPLLTTEGTN